MFSWKANFETNCKLLTFISVNGSIILIAGGWDGWNDLASVEVISDDARNNIQLPDLPETITWSSMINHNGVILLCGGENNGQTCLKMEEKGWNHHSNLKQKRSGASVVATNTATFIFGGFDSKDTYEYLEQGSSSNWQEGKATIPGYGFRRGCAIALSDEEVWLIGGLDTESRIMSFNTTSHMFKEEKIQLNENRQNRFAHRCIRIPGTTKIMVSGGRDS